jgi:hypothetical protein
MTRTQHSMVRRVIASTRPGHACYSSRRHADTATISMPSATGCAKPTAFYGCGARHALPPAPLPLLDAAHQRPDSQRRRARRRAYR